MSIALPPPGLAPEPVARAAGRIGLATRIARSARGCIKLCVGVLLCFHYLGSVLVVGWTARLMRRRVLHHWWRRSPVANWQDFDQFVREQGHELPGTPLPAWFVGERIRRKIGEDRPGGRPPGWLRRTARIPGALFESLGRNLKVGLFTLGVTYAATGPGCLLWLGSWYAGWNNSFHKGYEQAAVGPLTGVLGTILFILAMTYVPMAWAHAAAAGDPRAFFDFGLIRRVCRSRPAIMALYALIFSLAQLPVSVMKVLPLAFTGINPALEEAGPEEVQRILTIYHLACAAVVFSAYLMVHLLAARIYATSLTRLLARDPSLVTRLHPAIARSLDALELLPAAPPRRKHPLVAVVLGTGRWGTDLVFRVATFLLWFTVVAQLFVTEFLIYHPFVGWMNQPLVHLPSLFVLLSGAN